MAELQPQRRAMDPLHSSARPQRHCSRMRAGRAARLVHGKAQTDRHKRTCHPETKISNVSCVKLLSREPLVTSLARAQ